MQTRTRPHQRQPNNQRRPLPSQKSRSIQTKVFPMNHFNAFQIFEILDFIERWNNRHNGNFPYWFELWNAEFGLIGAN